MTTFSLYNSQNEIGLRCLYLLSAVYPTTCSLDKLLYMDYFLIYIEDIDSDGQSLHPQNPLRVLELFEKRHLLQKGLQIMLAKNLISIEYNEGIFYGANCNTHWFLDSVNNEYALKLLDNSKLIAERFRNYSEYTLKIYVQENIARWGNEFKNYFSIQEDV